MRLQSSSLGQRKRHEEEIGCYEGVNSNRVLKRPAKVQIKVITSILIMHNIWNRYNHQVSSLAYPYRGFAHVWTEKWGCQSGSIIKYNEILDEKLSVAMLSSACLYSRQYSISVYMQQIKLIQILVYLPIENASCSESREFHYSFKSKLV